MVDFFKIDPFYVKIQDKQNRRLAITRPTLLINPTTCGSMKIDARTETIRNPKGCLHLATTACE